MELRKAYFHLPGLFEFYELYRVFLPLYRTHRDWFYDWCEIGSLYGAPADCLWGGGRTGCSRHTAREVLALAQEYGISARLTFSNSLLREEHLTDPKCNALCAQFAQGSVQNGVIVHSDLLVQNSSQRAARRPPGLRAPFATARSCRPRSSSIVRIRSVSLSLVLSRTSTFVRYVREPAMRAACP